MKESVKTFDEWMNEQVVPTDILERLQNDAAEKNYQLTYAYLRMYIGGAINSIEYANKLRYLILR